MSNEARRQELLAELEAIQGEWDEAGLRSQIAARSESVLTPRQIKVVGLLALNGPMRSSQMATALGVTRATMTGLLDRLESARLVTRKVDPRDGRGRLVQATERGRRALTALISLGPSPDRLLELLTEEELKHLVVALRALTRAAARIEGGHCGIA
ncbi:MAG: MarR family transcriptional regulator [Bifidobacteriaceae bacterium]|nr:MarR family transcriptional regulator [Bifidobacteriaceae bacterium]